MTEIESLIKRARRESLAFLTRRHFLKDCSLGLGAMALSGLLPGCSSPPDSSSVLNDLIDPLAPKSPHFPGKAKAAIYLHMAGAASAWGRFYYNAARFKGGGQACPQTFLDGRRFALIPGRPKILEAEADFKKGG